MSMYEILSLVLAAIGDLGILSGFFLVRRIFINEEKLPGAVPFAGDSRLSRFPRGNLFRVREISIVIHNNHPSGKLCLDKYTDYNYIIHIAPMRRAKI